jgi:beta-lactamase regulating signal transducer with metallopeptidase domain
MACGGLALCLLLPIGTFTLLRPAVFRQVGEQAVIVSGSPKPAFGASSLQSRVVRMVKLPRQMGSMLADHLSLLFKGWLLGSLVLALRFGGGWLHLLVLRRAVTQASQELQDHFNRLARRFGLTRDIRLALSSRISTPMVVGWLRPMLLVPVGILTDMDPVGLEALLVHELAHIRRHDYFLNVLQCLVEILLFYHPAVWWISRRVRVERELCCDDVAVAWCADPLLYAETLNRLQEQRSETLSPALAAGGGDLMYRIKRLVIPSLNSSTVPIRQNLLAMACSVFLVLGTGLSLKAMQARPADDTKWFLAGSNRKSFVLSADPKVTRDGKPSQYLASSVKDPEGFGTIMQGFDPADYIGKRVRMSAWVKTAHVSSWAGLWMRVDGAADATLAFDNMGQRPIRGTTDWKRYDVVLDVAPGAKHLAFGLLLDGPGQTWLNDLKFEVVDASVAVTDMGGDSKHTLPVDYSADGWFLTGSKPKEYELSLDSAVLHEGNPTHLLAFKVGSGKGFGTLMQMFKGTAYLGRRVRVSTWVKSEQVEDWAGVWMRVDGPDGKPTAFDNMRSRAIKGSLDWKPYQVVLDVAPDSAALAFGILLTGKGKVWMAEPILEVVDASVPVTGQK